MSANGMGRPCSCPAGDRSWQGAPKTRSNLRVLFVQAAWVVLIKPQSWERHGLRQWIEAAKKRLHRNVLAIALANKLARIAWRSGSWPKLRGEAGHGHQPLSLRLLPAEVCERRDGGSVFPARSNTGDPNGPLRPFR